MPTNELPSTAQDAALALSPKQLAFVHRYQEIGNKVQAYRDVYQWTGSYHAAQVEAYRLSRHPAIALLLGDAVATVRAAAQEAALDTVDRLVAIATVPAVDPAARQAVAVQAERLLSDIAQLTGQGSRVTVNVQQNAINPSDLWASGGAEVTCPPPGLGPRIPRVRPVFS
jgi:hypothetical protein